MKPQIKIADTQFSHTPGGSFGTGDLCIPPTYFEWYRGRESRDGVIVVTESQFHLADTFTEPVKIALLLEPPMINSQSYDWIGRPENYKKFSYVLTYNLQLCSIDSRFIWYPFGGCWIRPHEQKIYPKTKDISIIASRKRETEGHKLRHKIIAEYGDRLGVYGNGYTYVENKIEALRHYKFSVVVENDECHGFFSEKLIDCFRTGTIPIFWGDLSTLSKMFNINGVYLLFESRDIKMVSPERYYDKDVVEAVEHNFQEASKYIIPEDWLWLNFFKKYSLI